MKNTRTSFLVSLVIVGVLLSWAVSQAMHEHFNVVALLVAAGCFYYLGARFYSTFLANRVLQLDDNNITPAHRLRDNHDYLPYRRWTLFGMHFAWIAGPGPLIGPTLAAQFGFLPGFLWIVLGAVLMGCVQDMVILAFSTRRDGMSLARMIKNEVSPLAGLAASVAVLFILEILLGVLALTVVNALKSSPWATFTIASSIPIAFFVGWYMTKFRPGQEGQGTVIGIILLLLATAGGHYVAENPTMAAIFTRSDVELTVAMVVYGFFAAALPAWLLLAPRDNISTYLKIGTVALLAIGIFIAQPTVQMPAVTRFIDGSGPIVSGGIFPFCFIIIACGAISGFHSLISSGVTPRLVDRERDIRFIGYGAMLTESFVGVMSLIAAITLVPGVYLAMNIPTPGGVTTPDAALALTQKVSALGPVFQVSPADMNFWAQQVGEKSLYSRAGGGPSLAVGMAHIFGKAMPAGLVPFWYHFAIMFEAVFILTVIDSGTRVIRFVINEMLTDWRRVRSEQASHAHLHAPVWLTSGLAVVGWGALLYWGIADKEGGTKALLKMFGVANQMLAVIALSLATVIMLKRHRKFVWVTAVPMLAVASTTLTAAFQMIFSSNPKVGALAAAQAAAKSIDPKMHTVQVNALIQTGLVALLLFCVLSVLVISIREIARLWRMPTIHLSSDLQPQESAS